MVSAVALAVGFALGSRRIPWAGIAVATAAFFVLHTGKAQMREEYWYPDLRPVGVLEFPRFFGEWFGHGFRELAKPDELKDSQSIYERVSLMHLLLLAQRMSPDVIPFLRGESYVTVLRILVPRVLDPDKPSAHDSTRLLSLHYGLQTEEEQEGTQIGWGYLNEGFANFGFVGVLLVGVFIGLLLGGVARYSAAAPFMSIQNLLGIMMIVIAVQTDFTVVVLTAAVAQSWVGILFLTPFFDRRPAGAGSPPP